MHRHRHARLRPREKFRITAKLDQELRLRRAREFRVQRLVAITAERRGRFDASQEVGVADKVPRPERRLVDDGHAAPHRIQRRSDPLIQPLSAGQILDFDAGRAQPIEVSRLVRETLAADEFRLRARLRALKRRVKINAIQPGEVLALEKIDEIGGRTDDAFVEPLHCPDRLSPTRTCTQNDEHDPEHGQAEGDTRQ